ncbi:MAG TPA: GNAT family N-acetyltransferase [Gemmatimonadaceae bacterium]|jgi:predicted GNAT family acetyltransferase|nr:GNAT family N-acetyltransferase [Gemmatimonadaceae bacterium]
MHTLDHPIWHALTTVHAGFSEGDGLARRYRVEIGPLAAVREQSPHAYEALGALLGPTDVAVLFLTAPPTPPDGWRVLFGGPMEQMVCETPAVVRSDAELVVLGDADIPAMRALAELTEPGPFSERTIDFGGYLGIRDGARLVAMTGQRLAVPGFTEVSAVCTHPDYRGRGYAAALVSAVARAMVARGVVPFLEVRQDNVGAIRVYERLGFRIRRTLHFTALQRPR